MGFRKLSDSNLLRLAKLISKSFVRCYEENTLAPSPLLSFVPFPSHAVEAKASQLLQAKALEALAVLHAITERVELLADRTGSKAWADWHSPP